MGDSGALEPVHGHIDDYLNAPRTPEDDREDRRIGANIRFLRAEKGMSQQALAEAMRAAGQDHWRQNTVSRVENGRQELTLNEVVALEEILGHGLIAGTRIEQTNRAMLKGLERAFMLRVLREAHEALLTAEANVRKLRSTLGDPEEGDGGEHPEAP